MKEIPKIEILNYRPEIALDPNGRYYLRIGFKKLPCECCKRPKSDFVLWDVIAPSKNHLELLELALESLYSIEAAHKFNHLLSEIYEQEKRS